VQAALSDIHSLAADDAASQTDWDRLQQRAYWLQKGLQVVLHDLADQQTRVPEQQAQEEEEARGLIIYVSAMSLTVK